MTMSDRPNSDDHDRGADAGLDAFFAARVAADGGDAPPADFLARVLADAEALRPATPSPVMRGAATAAPGWSLSDWLSGWFGGWPAAAGLVAASLTGVWIGFTSPDLVPGFRAETASAEFDLADLMPGYGDAWAYEE